MRTDLRLVLLDEATIRRVLEAADDEFDDLFVTVARFEAAVARAVDRLCPQGESNG